MAGQNLTGTPDATANSGANPDEWHFSFHGFSRFPMRLGFGNRPSCPAGAMPNMPVTPSGSTNLSTSPFQIPCAAPGQSNTNIHTPFTPDTQYLDWRYDRQQEYDWTELFFNYGNSMVNATVGIQAFGFSDPEYILFNNVATQLGIAQGYLTIHPDLGTSDVRLTWKVGAFWDRYGMASEYDAGKYDTYMFGRMHTMGETLNAEFTMDNWKFRLSHGIGTKAEQVAFTQLQAGTFTPPATFEDNLPGFTLTTHGHAGVSYKRLVDINLHYITSWTNDYRAVGVENGALTDGHIDVYGGEVTARLGPIGGRLYAAYSRINAYNPQAVGGAVESVHSIGGGNSEGANGIVDNFLGCELGVGAGMSNPSSGWCETAQNSRGAIHGTVDTVEVQYEYPLGTLIKRLADSQGQWDAYLAIFGMYSSVSSTLKAGLNGQTASDLLGDGVQKLKYGADLIFTPLSWLGIGVRGDFVQPTNINPADNAFWVISPKLIFKTKWQTHEEITLWYSHYGYGKSVFPQPPNGTPNPQMMGVLGPFPPDENVVGLKGTVWW